LEDDSTDNLDKVWCFLENIRDPLEPESGCYSDTKWSERDGRFWSSLACFQAPDIEGGNNPKRHPGHVNRHSTSTQRRKSNKRKPPTTRRTTRTTTQPTTRRTTRTTTQQPTTVADYSSETGHTFNFTYDYQYSDYEEYNEDLEYRQAFRKELPVKEDRGFTFILGETNLPGFKDKQSVDISADVAGEEFTREYVQDTVELEEVTEAVEISILDDLNELINEINQQSIRKETNDQEENTIEDELIIVSSTSEPSDAANKVEELFPNFTNLNRRIPPESVESFTTTAKPAGQNKPKSRKVAQPKRKKERSKQSPTTEAYSVTEIVDQPFIDEIEISLHTSELTEKVSTTKTLIPSRRPKQRKRSHKYRQRKVPRKPTTTIYPPTTEQRLETSTNTIFGPAILEDSAYELYTDQDSNIPSTITPNFFFGINIDL